MSSTSGWPSPDDLLRYLERGRSHAPDPLLSGLALFGTGLLVGAGMALLFAPSSGEELRNGIAEKVEDLQQRVGATAAPNAEA